MRRGVFRTLDGRFAAHVVAVTLDVVQSRVLLERIGLTAGDAFSELGDLLLDGPSSGQDTSEPPPTAADFLRDHISAPTQSPAEVMHQIHDGPVQSCVPPGTVLCRHGRLPLAEIHRAR